MVYVSDSFIKQRAQVLGTKSQDGAGKSGQSAGGVSDSFTQYRNQVISQPVQKVKQPAPVTSPVEQKKVEDINVWKNIAQTLTKTVNSVSDVFFPTKTVNSVLDVFFPKKVISTIPDEKTPSVSIQRAKQTGLKSVPGLSLDTKTSQVSATLTKPVKIQDIPDALIEKAQTYLEKNYDSMLAKSLAAIQQRFEKEYEKPGASASIGVVKGVTGSFIGSTKAFNEYFDKPIVTPKNTFQQTQMTIGEMMGTVAAWHYTGRGIQAVTGFKSVMPILFGLMGQMSLDAQATAGRRIEKLSNDVITGWLFEKIPVSNKILSKETAAGAVAAGALTGASSVIDKLTEGMGLKDAIDTSWTTALIGAMFHTVNVGYRQFTSPEFLQKGETFTPNDLRQRASETDIPAGTRQAFKKMADAAEAQGKDIKIDVIASKQSPAAKIVGKETVEAVTGKPQDIKLKNGEGSDYVVTVEYVDAKGKLPAEKTTTESPKPKTPAPESIEQTFLKERKNYTSAKDLAQGEYGQPESAQIGYMNPDTIIARDSIDRAAVDAYKKDIEEGKPVDPIVISSVDGNLETTDGSHRLTAYQELQKDVPVIYTGKKPLEGLTTFENAFSESASKQEDQTPVKEKTQPVEPTTEPPTKAIEPSKPAEEGKLMQEVKVLGMKGQAELLESYKGADIVKLPNDEIAVWNPFREHLFRVALDDSTMDHKIVPEANTIESAKKYIDHITSTRPDLYKPVTKEMLKKEENVRAKLQEQIKTPEQKSLEKKVQRVASETLPEKDGYAPTHPWYYRKKGDILPADTIPQYAETKDSEKEAIQSVYPKVKTNADAQAYYIKDLMNEVETYTTYKELGPSAITSPQYGSAEEEWYTAMSLLFSHIIYDSSKLKALGLTNEDIQNMIRARVETFERPLQQNDIIQGNEEPSVQPESIPDSSDVSAELDRASSQEIDERSLHEPASGARQSGAGPVGEGSTAKPVGKVGRQEINQNAEKILSYHNYETNPSSYTDQELAVLRQYSGSGGKAEAGATGKGLLSEYYTPQDVVDKVWEIAKKLSGPHGLFENISRILEPSVGTGALLSSDIAPVKTSYDAYEYQKVSGTIAKILHHHVDVRIGTGEEFGNPGNFETAPHKPEYSLVVGNPPFGDRNSFMRGKGEEPKIGRWEEYFIKRGLDSLNENGHLIYVVNSSFLNKGTSPAKEMIAKMGELILAYRLPEGIFADTGIGTDIVVFKKTFSTNTSDSSLRLYSMTDGNYFIANPQHVAGVQEKRTDRFGKAETYVKGTMQDVRSLPTVLEAQETAPVSKPKEKTAPIKKTAEPYASTVNNTIKKKSKEGALPAVITPDKKRVETVDRQTVEGGKATTDPEELAVLNRTRVDGSVEYSQKAKKYLNYHNGKYYHDLNYFSGDIYQKIADVKAEKTNIVTTMGQEQYTKQLTGLQAILPKPVTIKDITFDPLDRYVTQMTVDEDGVKVLDQFINYVMNSSPVLSYRVNKYDIRNYVSGFRASAGTKEIMGSIKADAARLFNTFVRDVIAPDVQDRIVSQYNREKNSYVNPDYSRIPTEVSGMAKYFRGKTFALSNTQANGVSFLTNKGVGLISYGVGVGKTHTLLTATMIAKQKGWTKKPAFVVPKSTLSKTWIGTIKAMFPNETIVNLGGLTKPDVERLTKARGRNPEDWIRDGEVSVLTHEGLLRLSLTPEELNGAMGDLSDALGGDLDATQRQQELQKAKLQEIVGKAQYKAGDIGLTALGIDHLSVDEVHNFRKIFQGAKPESLNPDGSVDKSKTRRFGNVVGGTPSKQAQQLFLVAQHILKRNNNRGVYLASATPFENHATEVYNILSLVARDRMKKMGIFNINDFFALYSNFETELEKSVKGDFVNKEKMKSFRNLPQLQKLLREFVDYQVDPTLVRPERRVLTPQLQMSQKQVENLKLIQEIIKPPEGKKPEDGAILKASTYSVANSVSPYFIKEFTLGETPTAEELVQDSPKIAYAMEIIKHIKNDPKTAKYGTFLYIGSNGVEYHGLLSEYLVKHIGFLPKEVAIINGSTDNDTREAIKDLFNDGKVKVLIGGDPTKEGIDLQNNGYTTINIALGWNPTEPAQVEGRVWRQGNKRSIAPLIYPMVENSGDITVYNKFEEKGSRINDLFSYQGQIFDVGELDPREKKLALMTNPEDKAAIEIEMDKAGLQNQLTMVATDINNLKRTKSTIESLKSTIEYASERVKTGTTQYGTTLDADRIAEYRKEVTKSKAELKGIEARLAAREIPDIDAQVATLETRKEEINIELGKISETYAQRLEKFRNEYNTMIANRKTLADHVADFVEKTKDLTELTDEQIAEQKASLMRALEQEQIIAKNRSYKTPSGNADTGEYSVFEQSEEPVGRIKSIEFPELVRMVKELTGNVPRLKAFRTALAKMYERGSGEIAIHPDVFKDPIQATKMLSHEIGHLADFIPDGFMTRGNIIGRIASLNKYMKATYGDLVNRDIKKELKRLTHIWKPFDPAISDKYTKYRYSSRELYADAVSVLLNDPGFLKKIAPTFYDGFFTYLHSKPEFEETYFDTMELLQEGEDAVNDRRLEDIYKGFNEAKAKRKAIEETVKPKKRFWETLMRNHITKFDPIYRKLDKLNVGVVESPKQKVREALEMMQLRRNDQALFLDRVTTEITDALEALGMNEEDLGVVLKLEREAMGDRVDLANPGGLIGDIPEKLLMHFYEKKQWSQEQRDMFEKIKNHFHDLIFAESQRAVENGNYNKEVFAEKIEPNRYTYATFSVVHYIHDNYIPAGIKQQVGTLSTIENPFVSTVLKTLALIDWNNVQEAKLTVMDELTRYFPDDATKAKVIRADNGMVIKFVREDGKDVLELMDNGQRIGYNVDPYIKSMFDNKNITADEMHAIVKASRAFNRFFKPLVTTYNLSWGFYSNIARDAQRTYTHLGAALSKYAPGTKKLTVAEMLVSYIKSVPEGLKFAKGQKDELIREILKNKAMTTTWSQYDPQANEDSDIAFLLRKHNLLEPLKKGKGNKMWDAFVGRLLDGIQLAGGTFEATSKISAYQIVKKRVADGKRAGFLVRNYAGTPNYSEGGAWKQMDNDIFVFSNVMLQATRSSAELGTDPKTASGFWFRNFLIAILPKILMAAGLAGLFGESVRRNYLMQTEYDKTNYNTIPVGMDENGKATYIRLPEDETQRFLGAIVWKGLSGIIQKRVNKLGQIAAIGAGYIPSVTPLWTFIGDWWQYLGGKNPYDSYRGRLAIDETSWKAGGLIRLNKMVQYSMNTVGIGNFTTYDDQSKSTFQYISEKIPIFNRAVKVSNYGLQEQFTSTAQEDAARRTLAKRDIIDKYVKQSKGITDPEELSALRTQMVREYFGELPTNKDRIAEAKQMAKKFMIQRERGYSPYMDQLISSNLNAEKLDYLLQYQKVMREDDFKQLVNDALKYKIIGPSVVTSLKEHDRSVGR